MTLVERILAVHAALGAAEIPFAFGGALALAFHVHEPRATRDIDINVFVGDGEGDRVFAALPAGVMVDAAAREAVRRDGQVRVLWDDTPLDLFFSVHPYHDSVATRLVVVPFAGAEVPVLDATDLVVFKVLFNRTKDWADIEAMVETATIDVPLTLGWLVRLLGTHDPRIDRFRGLAVAG